MPYKRKLAELKKGLREISDLDAAIAVLVWDQATYMPSGGAAARGRHIATLTRLSHERLTSPELGGLLGELTPYEKSLPEDSDDASLIRVTRRDYRRATRIPTAFLEIFQEHVAKGYQLWVGARPNNDFSRLADHLERTLELSRQYADFFPGFDHPADPLIDQSDEGMTVALLRPLFAELRRELLPMVEAMSSEEPRDEGILRRCYPAEQQLAFGLEVAQAFGYDLSRGRQDKTHHPFETSFGVGDVRITTRVAEDNLAEALFSTLHESGHAMYEQGVSASLEGTPLASGSSSGIHESQSRLWENLVGRSREFWEHYYPKLQARFPEQLGDISLESFYRAVNRVFRSLIRTEADEVTYNLHIIIRFDLELELLEGSLAVRDLPEAWRERYRSDLGVTPENDRDGVLQDVHWYAGAIGGAFQGYALGNILSAQFFEAAVNAHHQIPSQIADGQFATLHGWLREKLYRHGRKLEPSELVRRATGQEMSVAPYLHYLRRKYGELYHFT